MGASATLGIERLVDHVAGTERVVGNDCDVFAPDAGR